MMLGFLKSLSFNPIKIIKGKKRLKNEELMSKYLTGDEHNKRLIFSLSMIIGPVTFTYLFLMINSGLQMFNSRLFFYIPFLILISVIYRKRVNYEIKLINSCVQREEQDKN